MLRKSFALDYKKTKPDRLGFFSPSPFAASRTDNNFGSAAKRELCPRNDIFLLRKNMIYALRRAIYFAFAKCDIFRCAEHEGKR